MWQRWIRVVTIVRLFRGARKRWRRPQPSSVLVFDACGHESLLPYLDGQTVELLHVRGESFNVPMFIASLVRGRNFWDAYIDRYVASVRPRLVVTTIDNNIRFFSISQRHPGVKTLLVQNGWKSHFADVFEVLASTAPSVRSKFAVDYLLTFGSIVAAEYAKYTKGLSIVAGSIRNNGVPQTRGVIAGSVAFISQWQDDEFYMDGRRFDEHSFCRQVDQGVLTAVQRACERHGRRLFIIPRNRSRGPKRERESAYFRALLGQPPDFLEFEGADSGYRAVDAADLVVAIDSTLVYEALARGKRAAVFAIRSAILGVNGLTFGWPSAMPAEGPFWTSVADPDIYDRMLDRVITAGEAEWQRALEEARFGELMTYDPGNTILTSVLQDVLGPPPS